MQIINKTPPSCAHTQEYLLTEGDRLHMLLVSPYLHNTEVPELLVQLLFLFSLVIWVQVVCRVVE